MILVCAPVGMQKKLIAHSWTSFLPFFHIFLWLRFFMSLLFMHFLDACVQWPSFFLFLPLRKSRLWHLPPCHMHVSACMCVRFRSVPPCEDCTHVERRTNTAPLHSLLYIFRNLYICWYVCVCVSLSDSNAWPAGCVTAIIRLICQPCFYATFSSNAFIYSLICVYVCVCAFCRSNC